MSPTSELLLHGAPTGRLVPGVVLEAAVAAGGSYVVFLTDDVPFEDTLTIEYLDEGLSPLDSVRLGWPYSTGTFSDLRLEEPNRLSFRFMGEHEWSLELLSKSESACPS